MYMYKYRHVSLCLSPSLSPIVYHNQPMHLHRKRAWVPHHAATVLQAVVNWHSSVAVRIWFCGYAARHVLTLLQLKQRHSGQ